jgi:hypothetical protein
MDQSWDSSASQLSSLASRFDALSGAALVQSQQGGQAGAPDVSAGALAAAASADASKRASGSGPESLYIAVDKAGRAGMLSPKDQVLKQINQLEMSIVAAVPPQPPSLEANGLATAHTKKHRHRGGGAPAPAAAPAAEAAAPEAEGSPDGGAQPMPTSRIEGSVDAIAQRIYHRIRRRIASDRERFGG